MVADAVGDVLEDRHRERHRLLEHHADLAAQRGQRVVRRRGCSRRRAATSPRARLARIERVDAVEDAQQRRLAAARGADQRGDLLLRDVHVDVLAAPGRLP